MQKIAVAILTYNIVTCNSKTFMHACMCVYSALTPRHMHLQHRIQSARLKLWLLKHMHKICDKNQRKEIAVIIALSTRFPLLFFILLLPLPSLLLITFLSSTLQSFVSIHICSIWTSGRDCFSFCFSQNTTAVEALCRKQCMMKALGESSFSSNHFSFLTHYPFSSSFPSLPFISFPLFPTPGRENLTNQETESGEFNLTEEQSENFGIYTLADAHNECVSYISLCKTLMDPKALTTKLVKHRYSPSIVPCVSVLFL